MKDFINIYLRVALTMIIIALSPFTLAVSGIQLFFNSKATTLMCYQFDLLNRIIY